MNASVASQKTRTKCTGRYSKGLKTQNEEHLVNLCESKNIETQVILPPSYQNTAIIVN